MVKRFFKNKKFFVGGIDKVGVVVYNTSCKPPKKGKQISLRGDISGTQFGYESIPKLHFGHESVLNSTTTALPLRRELTTFLWLPLSGMLERAR